MSSAVSASAKGVTFLVTTQLSSRVLSFGINQILLRFASPVIFGASAQLELFLITVLYFSRECIRIVSQRETADAQVILNLSFVSIGLGLILTPLLAFTYTLVIDRGVPFAGISIVIYGVAVVTELVSEPCFLLVQHRLAYAIRAQAEATATLIRCIALLALTLWSNNSALNLGVLPFAIAQLLYAVALTEAYHWSCGDLVRQAMLHMRPTPVPSQRPKQFVAGYFPRSACRLAVFMYIQTAVKYALTQGDSLIISSTTSLREQGSFALASNYGGLVARTFLQPIEDSSRNLFAKLCTVRADCNEELRTTLTRARSILTMTLKLYNILALVAWSIAPSLAPLFLQLIAGQKWTDSGAGNVLATYCYYIPLLALNGVSEAFVAAVATETDLRRQSSFMGVYSIAFAGSAILFTKVLKHGADGIIWANCINMSLRMFFNYSYIKRFFASRGQIFSYRDTLPESSSISAAVGAATMMRRGFSFLDIRGESLLPQVTRGAFVTALLLGCIAVFERNFLKNAYFSLIDREDGESKKGES